MYGISQQSDSTLSLAQNTLVASLMFYSAFLPYIEMIMSFFHGFFA